MVGCCCCCIGLAIKWSKFTCGKIQVSYIQFVLGTKPAKNYYKYWLTFLHGYDKLIGSLDTRWNSAEVIVGPLNKKNRVRNNKKGLHQKWMMTTCTLQLIFLWILCNKFSEHFAKSTLERTGLKPSEGKRSMYRVISTSTGCDNTSKGV